ncbi:SH3 domain-containing protein [Maliponia aquimaris]|uniref:Bacterial SH3 domain protein n=1 Tax=Maliponia aquimaris TaxID=1673631 RepID=A0A238JPY7_9RHOB|nr:SH3 domain-containing protein [Maliponia aquimaris]SMX31826.1 Bacterial SH3 domain protein [Maliponia aquimaris]
MPVFPRAILVALSLIFSTLAAGSEAAEIRLGGSEEMGCRIEITGQIAAGDTDTLRALFEQLGYPTGYSPIGRRICLDSPGGLLSEGLLLADLIAEWNYGTAIADGAACESACAVAFMAGRFNNPEAGGAFGTDRLLHPRGKLGFHAPSLLLGDRSYSRSEVDTAYAIALVSMAGILEHRANWGTAIPDSLFLKLLGTPPFEMSYVETVGQAARWQIDVAPVEMPKIDVKQALTNACRHVDSGLLDYAPYFDSPPLEFSFEEITDEGLTAFSTRDFRYEGSAQCEVRLYASGSFNDYSPVVASGGAQYTGGATDQDVSGLIYPYMLYPTDQKIASLPVAQAGDRAQAQAFFRAARSPGAAGQVGGFNSCRLIGADARIVNVNEFVNIRAAPGLRAPVVGQVRLAERVQVPDTGRLLPLRDNDRARTCLSICEVLTESPSAAGVADEAQGCVDENMLWYEIIGQNGTTGYISRKFLSN